MQRIEALLRKGIGLDAASIGSSSIERTVRLRMKLHGLKSIPDYEQMLRKSAPEFDELIEAVVVTETWFFRDREPFNAFTQIVVGQWLPDNPDAEMRILSVPCSSGEEPYSMAMCLLDAGVPPERFQIDAVDISQNALARAERAVYGRNSFRGPDLTFRDRHFTEIKEGYALNPNVRQPVYFRRDNVLDDGFLADNPPYDFIFCRNLLIYFDRATQVLTLAKLHRLLKPGGMLFVGPAELPLVTEGGFTSANLPHAFACRKTDHSDLLPTSRSRRRNTRLMSLKSLAQAAPEIPAASADPSPNSELSRDNHYNVASLALARRLADSGQLEKATELCQAHLLQHQDCAEAYYLLGLVKDATNDPQAIEFYRKALYLDPNHYETLVHTAFWLERTGDLAAAQAFKRRAERAQPRNVARAT
jgi:chemotaxis protein methyltransferase WspC